MARLRMGNYIRVKRDMQTCSGYTSERCFKACRCRIGGQFASCGCDPPSGTNSGSRPGIQCIGRQWQASRDIAVDRKSCGDPIARRARGYQLWQTPRLREARFGGVPVLLEGRPRKTHNDAERIVLFMGHSGAGKSSLFPICVWEDDLPPSAGEGLAVTVRRARGAVPARAASAEVHQLRGDRPADPRLFRGVYWGSSHAAARAVLVLRASSQRAGNHICDCGDKGCNPDALGGISGQRIMRSLL